MSSLFDLSRLWNMFLVPSERSSSPNIQLLTHTRLCPPGSVRWDPEHANLCLSFILLFQKQTREVEAKRDRERNYKTCSRHSFQFNGRCSMSCFHKERIWAPILSTISYQEMTYGSWFGAWEGYTFKNVRVSVFGVETLPEAHQSSPCFQPARCSRAIINMWWISFSSFSASLGDALPFLFFCCFFFQAMINTSHAH